MDLRDTIKNALDELHSQSGHSGYVGTWDVNRIEFVIAGFPNDEDYREDQTQWVAGALAAICMVGPYSATTAAEAIIAATRGES